MDGFLIDVRFALRQIRRRPVFTVVAALSLAVGVGANTAIFSAVTALLLRPVPGVADHQRVVELGRTTRGRGFDSFAYPDFLDIREGVPALERVAAYSFGGFSFTTAEGGERIGGIHASESYFDVMGVAPALGRFFSPDEAGPGAPGTVAVLDHGFWRERLGGAPDVVGSTIRLNRVAFTVVGVMPPDFHGHLTGFRPDVYLPLRSSPLLRERADVWDARNSVWHSAVGRLADAATLEQAGAQVQALFARLAEAYPESNANRGGVVIPLGPVPGGGRSLVAGFLGVLMGLVGLILVVTCVNVAGMFLARGTAREREIAVRLAIGSGRGRVVRQLLTEALVVFAIGGGIGAALGAWGLGMLPIDRLPIPIPIHLDLSPDPVVLVFAVAITLVTGVLFGLLPALGATRLDLTSSLKEDGRGGGRAGALRRIFVSGQVGLSLVLLVSAGLLLRSLQEATGVDTGFDPTDAYMATVDLALEGYDEQTGLVLQDRLLEAVSALPGVEAAALAIDLPLDMSSHGSAAYPEGWTDADGREGLGVEFNHVSPAYFETLAIPVLAGRAFSDADRAGTEPVLIVSRSFVDAVWPGEAALGKAVRAFGSTQELRTVVGVVEDVPNQMITDAPDPFVYVPLAQAYRPSTSVVARAVPGAGPGMGAALREAILTADPSLSVPPVMGLAEYTSLGILPQRVAASITSVLGSFALLLSGLGIYGVVAFAVSRRTREIGIRMALGAGRRSVMAGVIRGGLALTLPGIVLGVGGALGVGHLMRFLLLGLSPADPVALGAVTAGLLLVIVAASAVPARRASAIQPVEALRSE
jgi:predicted permease